MSTTTSAAPATRATTNRLRPGQGRKPGGRDGRALSGTGRPPRRLSPRARKLALTMHVITSVGWLGIVVAMLVTGVAAATTAEAAVGRAGYALMEVFGTRVFPPAAMASLISGVVLSLGTKWGLVRYRWVVVKLVLTVAVIVTGAQLTGRLLEQATVAPTTAAVPGDIGAGLILGSFLHLVLLAAATAVSVYKPWGKTRRSRAADR